MNKFEEDLILKGLEQREAGLGADHVEKDFVAADDFAPLFQEAMTV